MQIAIALIHSHEHILLQQSGFESLLSYIQRTIPQAPGDALVIVRNALNLTAITPARIAALTHEFSCIQTQALAYASGDAAMDQLMDTDPVLSHIRSLVGEARERAAEALRESDNLRSGSISANTTPPSFSFENNYSNSVSLSSSFY